MNWTALIPVALAGLLVGVVFHWLPALRKRNLYFSVTVDPSFRSSPEGRAIAATYRWWVWTGVVLGWAVSAWAIRHQWTPMLGFSVLIGSLVGMLAWVEAWMRARPHAVRTASVRVVSLAEERASLPGGWLTIAGPYALLGTAFSYLWSHYAQLPENYPVHWGPAGRPDRWVDKSPQSVAFPALMGAGVLTLIAVTALAITHFAKRGSGGGGDFGVRHRRANLQVMAVTMWSLGALFAFVSLLPMMPPLGGWMLAPMLAPVVLILALTFRLYRLSTEPTGGSDGTPEECWKFGAFYYNPADPALMVEKRSGPGFTLNFGHPMSWVLLAGILGVAVLPALLRH